MVLKKSNPKTERQKDERSKGAVGVKQQVGREYEKLNAKTKRSARHDKIQYKKQKRLQ